MCVLLQSPKKACKRRKKMMFIKNLVLKRNGVDKQEKEKEVVVGKWKHKILRGFYKLGSSDSVLSGIQTSLLCHYLDTYLDI